MKLLKELNEMRVRKYETKKEIELRIKQIADQMEYAEGEGEKEELHNELQNLNNKLDDLE